MPKILNQCLIKVKMVYEQIPASVKYLPVTKSMHQPISVFYDSGCMITNNNGELKLEELRKK